MAQANSNVQREPSMEEILASIRRIIEDSDAANAKSAAKPTVVVEQTDSETETGAAGYDDQDESEVTTDALAEEMSTNAASASLEDIASEINSDGPSGHSSSAETVQDDKPGYQAGTADLEAAEEEVRSFREELSDDEGEFESETIEMSAAEGAADVSAGPATGDSFMNALSMADIGAEVARQADSSEAGDESADDIGYTSGEEADLETEIDAEFDQEDDEIFRESDTDQHFEQYEDLAGDAMAVSRESNHGLMDSPAGPRSVDNSAEQLSVRTPILSEQAGRKVAAAFDELSEAFSHTKKFDDMAAEMMRPMLQDWLDNNLPVLVERLVREEIDRVARGASR